MENVNIKINGKEIKQEDIDKAMLMFKEKFGDLNGNSVPDILDSLEKKGFQGKMLANIAKSYLKNNNISTEGIVTLVEDKISKLENDLDSKNQVNVSSRVTSKPVTEPLNTNEPFKINDNTAYTPNFSNTSKNFNINPSSSPFATILIYLIIAGVLTAVIYFVKMSFGF